MTTTAGTSRRTGLQAGVVGLVASALAGVVAADQRYRQARQLSQRSDHLLDDIGLTRRDIARGFTR